MLPGMDRGHMANSRLKGLLWCAEVRRILTEKGHIVDGPFFKAKWFGGRPRVIHEDIFGVWDLVSWTGGRYFFHQITDLAHKSQHEKKISEQGLHGYVWCRSKVNNRIKYRVFLNGCEIQEDNQV